MSGNKSTLPTEPVIERDYRIQGNCFSVAQNGRLLGWFVLESHAELFILALFDRQKLAGSAAVFDPFVIETAYLTDN